MACLMSLPYSGLGDVCCMRQDAGWKGKQSPWWAETAALITCIMWFQQCAVLSAPSVDGALSLLGGGCMKRRRSRHTELASPTGIEPDCPGCQLVVCVRLQCALNLLQCLHQLNILLVI